MNELGTHHAEFLLSSDLRASKKQEYSVADKLRAEAELLGSVPSNIGNGILKSAQDAWEHKWRSGLEIGAGLVLGSAFTLLSRNPNSAVRFTTTWMTRGFIGATAVDLTSRVAQPMAAVWDNPDTLNMQKVQLGNDLGDAALNYGLGIAGGIAGAKLTERYVAPTKLGSWLQGFKETTVSAQELGAMVPKATAGADGVVKNSFAGKTSDGVASSFDLSAGKVKLRELSDGSKIGSMSDGSVVVLTNDGTAMFFKSNSSMFGLKRNLELQQVVHTSKPHTDYLTTPLEAASRPSSILGRDPSTYLEGSARYSGAADANAPRISTDAKGAIRSVQTESGSMMQQSQKGDWQFKPSGTNNTTGLELKIPTYSLKATTDWFLGYRKSAQIGVLSKFLDTASELGSGILQHEIFIRLPGKNADSLKDNRSRPGN